MNSALAIIIYLLVIFYVISTLISLSHLITDGFVLALTPAEVHEGTRLNWFGSVMLYLLMVLIFPAYYLIALFRFIFTVGRISNDD